MRAAVLFLAIALPALAGETRPERDRSRESSSSSDWSDVSRSSSDWSSDWTQDTQSVPEASPTLAVLLAGAALVLRRNGGAK
jgi:hypothetical protein